MAAQVAAKIFAMRVPDGRSNRLLKTYEKYLSREQKVILAGEAATWIDLSDPKVLNSRMVHQLIIFVDYLPPELFSGFIRTLGPPDNLLSDLRRHFLRIFSPYGGGLPREDEEIVETLVRLFPESKIELFKAILEIHKFQGPVYVTLEKCGPPEKFPENFVALSEITCGFPCVPEFFFALFLEYSTVYVSENKSEAVRLFFESPNIPESFQQTFREALQRSEESENSGSIGQLVEAFSQKIDTFASKIISRKGELEEVHVQKIYKTCKEHLKGEFLTGRSCLTVLHEILPQMSEAHLQNLMKFARKNAASEEISTFLAVIPEINPKIPEISKDEFVDDLLSGFKASGCSISSCPDRIFEQVVQPPVLLPETRKKIIAMVGTWDAKTMAKNKDTEKLLEFFWLELPVHVRQRKFEEILTEKNLRFAATLKSKDTSLKVPESVQQEISKKKIEELQKKFGTFRSSKLTFFLPLLEGEAREKYLSEILARFLRDEFSFTSLSTFAKSIPQEFWPPILKFLPEPEQISYYKKISDDLTLTGF
jgi:hypothetical protein